MQTEMKMDFLMKFKFLHTGIQKGIVKYLKIFFLLFSVFNFNNLHAQEDETPPFCFTIEPSDPYDPPVQPPPDFQCGRSSDIFMNYFRHKESYQPGNNLFPITNAPTVKKKIKIRFVILNPFLDIQKNFWNTPADISKLNYLANRMNYHLNHNAYPSHPVSGFSSSYYNLSDTKVQVELTDIAFVYDPVTTYGIGTDATQWHPATPSNYGYESHGLYQDSILNIYFIYMDIPSVIGGLRHGAWASGGGGGYKKSTQLSISSIGSWNIYAVDNSYAALDIEARRFIHELGHNFGFPHLEDEYSSTSILDYLEDVFGPGYPTSNPMANNYMHEGAPWQTYSSFCFTPMQLGRLHRNMHMGGSKGYVYPNENVNNHPWQIDDDQTWDFPIKVFQNIVVNPGTTLTIKCEVQMPPDSRILVKKGGKLIIDGGWVHSYHAKARWNGIELEGDKNAPSNETMQGTVEMINGAIIENAWNGIRNFTWDNGAKGGGIIRANGSHFYNNWRSIELNDYPNENYTSSNCRIENCTFEIDNLSAIGATGGNFERQITAWNIKGGVNVRNSTFSIGLSEAEWPMHLRPRSAIESHSTGMTVYSCNIKDFQKGIYAISNDGMPGKNLTAMGNTITKVNRGIEVGAVAMSNIRGNWISEMINLSAPAGPDLMMVSAPVGIYLDQTWGAYVGCWNNIDMGGYSLFGLSRVGMLAKHTDKFGATLLDNAVLNASRGVQTQMNNPLLNITCNSLEDVGIGIAANPNSANYILKDQGTGCNPNDVRAGNKFINNGTDIRSYTTNTWNYYAATSSLNPNEAPYNTVGTVNVSFCNLPGGDENSQCNKDWRNCSVLPIVGLADAIGDYRGLKESELWQSAEAQVLYSNIVNSFCLYEDEAGLINFLTAEADAQSLRLLIPLYISRGNYTQATATINSLGLSSGERDAYHDYFNIVADMHLNQRHPASLTTDEQLQVAALAAGDYEVSGFAKAMLEMADIAPWIHDVEEGDGEEIMAKPAGKLMPMPSALYPAVPNPAQSKAVIDTYIGTEDAGKMPMLIVRNLITGAIVFKANLTQGHNSTEVPTAALSSGVYAYSLTINGKVLDVQKLSVIK